MKENSHTCERCGTSLSEVAAGGLCPRCLMAMNFDSKTMPEGEAPAKVAPLSPEELAERFPQYEILECLGRGGMGVVYKARHKALERVVAIKVLAGEWQGDSSFSARFQSEAKLLAQMSHPNIVTVHDFGETDGLFYIVMEYIDGVNLRDLLREGKLEAKQALAIIPPICDALQYAHDKGIVHRDIKPENLLLDRDGRVKIADFGIASLMGAAGEIAGTPPYMAPEQTGGNIDHRADIYALGVVLYEMLTGERPDKEVIAPSRKVQIDVRLDEVVLRALERKPELRFQQATAMKTRLEIIADQDASGRPNNWMASYPVPRAWFGYEYRSSKTLLGLPLLHVANGLDPLTGKPRHARGIIALGGVATGWLAIGGRAYGGIAFGGVAVGVLALGGIAVGVVSFGGLTLALVLALGGMAIAPVALGGMAIGYLAMGGQAIGVHVVDGRHPDTAWLHQTYRAYQSWLFGVLGSIWLLLLVCFAGISAWAKSRSNTTDPAPPPMRETFGSSPPSMPRGEEEAVSENPPGMVRRWWWVFPMMVPVSVMLALMAAAIFNYIIPKKFETEATIEFQTVDGLPQSERSLPTAFDRIKASGSLAKVSQRLDLQNRWMLREHEVISVLKSLIIVQSIRGTDLVSIRVRHTSPQDAVDVANAVVEVAKADPEARVFLHETPVLPKSPVSPNLALNLVLAGFVGLFAAPMLGFLLAAVLNRVFPEKRGRNLQRGVMAERSLEVSHSPRSERVVRRRAEVATPEQTPEEGSSEPGTRRKSRRKKVRFRLHDRTPGKAALLGIAALCLFVGALLPAIGEPLWQLITSERSISDAVSTASATSTSGWLPFVVLIGFVLLFATMVFSLVLVVRSNGSGATKALAAVLLILLFGGTMAVLGIVGIAVGVSHRFVRPPEMPLRVLE